MSKPRIVEALLSEVRATWLVTGVAGFIGSNLLEALLRNGQQVVGLDSFVTGHRKNLDEVRKNVGEEAWARFSFTEGDICDLGTCHKVCTGVDYVLHQAALGSVPRSLEDPLLTHNANATGGLNMLVAARDAGVKRFVYAASSSTYGDDPDLPKVEEKIGNPLSPYAVTKYVNELYADVFTRAYGMSSVGLRYFNVFGPRQDPNGAYAAVIPLWIASLIRGETVFINGDGGTSRDFCFVENVIQANVRAALSGRTKPFHSVYNVAVGDRTSLNELFFQLCAALRTRVPSFGEPKPTYRDFRAGDVRHSLASIEKARNELGYEPTHSIGPGLEVAMDWYVKNLS